MVRELPNDSYDGRIELELLGARKDAVSDRRTKCELLLRSAFIGMWSVSPWLCEKNVALDAVIGVEGVFVAIFLGGGVSRTCSLDSGERGSCFSLSFKASILALIGVLNGSKFNGGNFNGCKLFLLILFFDLTSVFGIGTGCLLIGVSSSFKSSRLAAAAESALAYEASSGRLDLRCVKNGTSVSYLGDSYALGIAGTGGTSSVSPVLPPLAPSFRGLGVGNLEVEADCGSLGCRELLELRAEFMLVFDDSDIPELYDFLFGSGVVRDEDGVTLLLRGIIDGDCADDRGRPAFNSFWVGGVGGAPCGEFGIGGAFRLFGIIDMRFIRLASVGLIVRAPNPDACGGITDILLDDCGVRAPSPAFPGVLAAWLESDLE